MENNLERLSKGVANEAPTDYASVAINMQVLIRQYHDHCLKKDWSRANVALIQMLGEVHKGLVSYQIVGQK